VEWTALENYLIANGYNYDNTTTGNKYAKALASNAGWTASTVTGAVGKTDYTAKRNITGFTALPAGNLNGGNGAFSYQSSYTWFWSSSAYDTASSYFRNLEWDYVNVYRNAFSKNNGASVRCLRNN
jgi:uncharacterized protein (TIGR02145 family)